MNINRVRFGSQNIANRKPSLSNQVPQQRRQMYEKKREKGGSRTRKREQKLYPEFTKLTYGPIKTSGGPDPLFPLAISDPACVLQGCFCFDV